MPVGGPSSSSPWSDRPFAEPSPSSIRFGASPITLASRQPATASPSDFSTDVTLNQRLRHEKPIYRLSRCHTGNNWYFKGIGILSPRGRQWISDGAGERVFMENFDIFADPVGTIPHIDPIALAERPRPLPPRDVCDHLVEIFFDSKTSILFPFLDSDIFGATVDRAYHVDVVDLGAQACIWALIALMIRTTDSQQFGLNIGPRDCIHEATRLLTINNGNTNLDSLQATLLLVSHLTASEYHYAADLRLVGVSKNERAMPRGFCHLYKRLPNGMRPWRPFPVITPSHPPTAHSHIQGQDKASYPATVLDLLLFR